MALFSRANESRKLRRQLEGDMRGVGEIAEPFADAAGDGSFDLLACAIRAFELGATRDVELLISRGIDGREFYLRELEPNWHELSREERATKIATFVRFANLLDGSQANGDGSSAPEGIGELRATVHTKMVLLACAYDVTYSDDYCRRIAKNPRRFGEYELPGALANA